MALIAMDDGVRINVEADTADSRPALLLSNSLGTNLGMWDSQMAAFRARYRVIRYDSRGHGKSEVPKGPYSIDRLGRDALGILDHLGLDRVYFCGLSKGGMVGQWLGSNAPERLIRLVLADTAPRMASPTNYRQRAEIVRRDGMGAVVDAVVGLWFTPPFRERRPDEVERIRAGILATPPEGYASCCEAIADMDQSETIRAITTPTLVLVGAEDKATSPAQSEFIHERIAGSKLVLLPDAAHLANVEQPEAFSRAVLDFFAG